MPATDPILMIVPLEAMSKGVKACVTAIRAKTFKSNIFLATSISESSTGAW